MAWVLNILIIVVGLVSFNQLSNPGCFLFIESPILPLKQSYDAGPDVIKPTLQPMEGQLMGLTGLKNIFCLNSLIVI